MRVGALFATLTLDRSKFDSSVRGAGGMLTGLSDTAKRAGLVIGAALAGVALAGGALAIDFEKSMANVQTLIGSGSQSEARIQELGASVKQMSLETGKSLDDLGEGLYDVIGTFGDSADAAKWLEIAAKSGSAGMSSTKEAIGLLSAVTKSYGDTSLEAAQKASDLAFETANLGVTTFPEMAASMGKVLPIAATLGISQEELFASMATLTGVTGSTAEVVTQLRGAMTAFIKPNASMTKALKEMGFESGAAAIESLGLQGALDAVTQTSTANEVGLAKVLGRSEALVATLSLTGEQADKFAENLTAMGDAAGATESAFEIQQATVASSMERMWASINVLLVNLGEQFLPVIQSVLDWVMAHMPEIQATFEQVFAAIGVAIGWLVENILPVLIAGFEFFVQTILPALISAFEFIASDVLPVLAAAFAVLTDEVLPPILAALGTLVNDFLMPLAALIADNLAPVLAALGTIILATVVPALIAKTAAVWAATSGFLAMAAATLVAMAPFIAIAAAIAGVVWILEELGLLQPIIELAMKAIGAAVDIAGKVIGGAISIVTDTVFPAFAAGADLLSQGIGAAFDIITGIVTTAQGVIEGVVNAITSAWEGLTGVFGTVADTISGIVKGGFNFVIGIINGLIGAINSVQVHIPFIGIGDIGIGPFDWNGLNIPKIPLLAAGTPDWMGGLAIVGERGPELVNLPRHAQVFPSDVTQELVGMARGGSAPAVGTMNVIGWQPGDVEREIKRAQRRQALEFGLGGAA